MLPLTVADIAPNDERFLSEGCGEWSDELTPIAEPGRPFGDGTYIVGLDIAPGRYRATAPSDSCFWLRLSNFGIFSGKYGTHDIRTTAGGWGFKVRGADASSIVDIEPGDTGFHSEGCGTWTADLTPIVTPGQPFVDGAYVVGDEIAPGRYRAREPSAECYWARLHDFSGEYGEVYDESGYHFVIRRSGPTSIVDIAPDDAGFYSRGCGTWSDDLSPVTAPGEPFPDGTYLVGVDIAPGRYRATAPTDRCLWFRLDEFGGIFGAYEGGFAISVGWLPVVDVAPSDAGLLTSGCGTWSDTATPIVEPGTPFGDGVYLVGIDIAPGRYRASAPSDACSWWRLNGFRGDLGYGNDTLPDITAYGGFAIVDILETDAGFRSDGCGTWSSDLTPVATPGQPFGDGTYIVGIDIAPGRYRAALRPRRICEWARLGGFTGELESQLIGSIHSGRDRRTGSQDPAPTIIVDILPSDEGFWSEGCGAWSSDLTPIVSPGEPFGDGTFLVGAEIAPGRYRGVAADGSRCYWQRLSGFGAPDTTIERSWFETGSATVEIAETDTGFVSSGCGTWTPDPP